MSSRILIDEYLETDRLMLRCRQFDDNVFIFEATRYKGFNDGMSWDPPQTIKELEERYYGTITNWINGNSYSFIVIDKTINHRIGMISIRMTETLNKWSIGYWVHPEKQRQGYMKEAVARILQFGFERLNAESIQAQYAVWNISSEKVLTHNGFKFVESIDQGFQKNNEWVKENKMEITRKQFIIG